MTGPVDWNDDVPPEQQCTSARLRDRVEELLGGLKPAPGEDTVEGLRGRWAACDRHRNSLARRLSVLQAAFAASQADLTAALAMLNTFREAVDEKVQAAHRQFVEVCAERGRLKDNERRWAAEVEYAERERDEALKDLAWQREVVGMLRKNEEIRAQVIRERNAERERNRAELASARKELGQLRPIADAARAYATFPGQPATSDPNKAHMWNCEMEAKYLALLAFVTEAGTA